MKRKTTYFLAGVLVVVLLLAMSVSALASDGSFTITIHPIKIMVNGEVFQPKDVNGNDVMVFTVNGTTYAPLRALAEAYGLEVGYDAQNNIATVNGSAHVQAVSPTVQMDAATDFKSAWTVKEKPVTNYGNEKIFTASYNGTLGMQDFKVWWKSLDGSTIQAYAEQIAVDALELNPGYRITMYFDYNGYMLGTVVAESGYVQGNFRTAEVWIK